MRTLDELGISPAPWKRTGDWIVANANYDPIDGTTESTRVVETKSSADARLIRRRAGLYEALRLCATRMCHDCRLAYDEPCENGCEYLKMAKAALAAASGESEVAK